MNAIEITHLDFAIIRRNYFIASVSLTGVVSVVKHKRARSRRPGCVPQRGCRMWAVSPTSIGSAALALISLAFPIHSALAAQHVTDKTTKSELPRAAFPGKRVDVSAQKPLDWKAVPWPQHELPDAGESEYEVTGAADKFEESWAMDNVPDDSETPPENVRRLRFRGYEVRARNDATEYVGLAHYQFTGIKLHPFCCEWVC